MCVSFNNIYNESTNYGSITSIFNPNRVIVLDNDDDQIYITNTNPVYLYSTSSNYLYVLDEMMEDFNIH